MCGVLGIYGNEGVFAEILSGLNTIQHRGQDSAGIVTLKGIFHIKKGLGLVNEVFRDGSVLPGKCGIGHVRYATQGSTGLENAQPFTVNYPFGLAMAHNGNVTNFEALRHSLSQDHHRLLETTSDIELIAYQMVLALEKRDLHKLSPTDIFEAIQEVQKTVEGAYAVVAVIAGFGLLGFTGPHGIRPLLLGRKGQNYAITSETTTLDYLGYELVHEFEGNESVFIDKNRELYLSKGQASKPAFCVFESIYFAREDSRFKNRLVAAQREALGRLLAKHFTREGLKPDIIIDVPSSSYFCAQGIAEELGIPLRRGLVKNNYIGRSFIAHGQKQREKLVKQKHNAISEIIKDKRIAVVDDSIVRGTTAKHIVGLLKQRGAKEVYFVSASPQLKHPCVYGIDVSEKEMILSERTVEDVRKLIGAEALIYPTLEDLYEVFPKNKHCAACFSGEYPTRLSSEVFSLAEREKINAGRLE
ncbi:MAG: amidophosphoribosyltransferase [Deltaproteobacteria bacterium]|nr:amidophosphoribosyltransferase [Deltaproteobacteria bacterium]